jgi:hypothetical protein
LREISTLKLPVFFSLKRWPTSKYFPSTATLRQIQSRQDSLATNRIFRAGQKTGGALSIQIARGLYIDDHALTVERREAISDFRPPAGKFTADDPNPCMPSSRMQAPSEKKLFEPAGTRWQ